MVGTEYYSEENHGRHEYLDLGDFPLIGGGTLPGAKLSYKTHGSLNDAKDNAILFPHMYSGTPKAMEGFIGEGRPLDPAKYFIILPGQFGNGFSSSPSNMPAPLDKGRFPQVTYGDDVVAQHRLVTEVFGITELQLVLGWSMGAAQTFEWAVRYPDMVKRAAPFGGTGKTTPHNFLFVQMHENAIKSDPGWKNGDYGSAAEVEAGLKLHAEMFAVLGACPELYKQEKWREIGFDSLEAFMGGFWEAWFKFMDPNNLLTMGWKWRHGDVSLHTDGDLPAALGRIKAKMFNIAFANDMFFPLKDIEDETALIANAECRVIDSLWAHFAMFCLNDADREAIDGLLSELLAIDV